VGKTGTGKASEAESPRVSPDPFKIVPAFKQLAVNELPDRYPEYPAVRNAADAVTIAAIRGVLHTDGADLCWLGAQNPSATSSGIK
jgi:hypothetical protein